MLHGGHGPIPVRGRRQDHQRRRLERISEASKKLEGHAEILCPEIAWPALRALGNLLRHEYDRVEAVRIWLMIEDDLPSLKASVERVLQSREPGPARLPEPPPGGLPR